MTNPGKNLARDLVQRKKWNMMTEKRLITEMTEGMIDGKMIEGDSFVQIMYFIITHY